MEPLKPPMAEKTTSAMVKAAADKSFNWRRVLPQCDMAVYMQ